MKAFVTGISGFVGSHLAEHLRAVGDVVLGTARGGDPLRNVPNDVEIVGWDLAEPTVDRQVRDAFERFAPEVVYHLAALSIPADCGAGEPSDAARALNVDGVRRVLDLAGSLPRPARVVFASTSHVYASVDPRQPIVDEQAPCAPRSAYGRTKLEAEQLCRTLHETSGADVVIARLFPQAGPRQDPRLMLAEWSRQFAGREPVIRVGNLRVTVDVLDVRDGVRALRELAIHGTSGAVYNVGSGSPCTTGELFDLLRRAAGDDRPWQERESATRAEPLADIGKLRECSTWRPNITHADTVAEVWKYWYEQSKAYGSTASRQQQQQQQ